MQANAVAVAVATNNEIRDYLGLSHLNRYPIHRVAGSAAPRLDGRGYYHTTPSGKTIVRYPNSYGWPTLYHPSTMRIVVGRDWRP